MAAFQFGYFRGINKCLASSVNTNFKNWDEFDLKVIIFKFCSFIHGTLYCCETLELGHLNLVNETTTKS